MPKFIPFLLSVDVKDNIQCQIVEYKDGETILEGYLCYDKSIKNKRPVVIVMHEWNGIGDHIKMRCQKLAQLGYVAFAADIYGKGVRPTTFEEAKNQATIYRSDIKLMRRRANLAFEEIKKNQFADTKNIAAMGYCFGGGVALELARSGVDLKGVVSFHGHLDTPNRDDAKNIKGKVLICHGADDRGVTLDSVLKFIDEMKNAGTNYEIDIFGGAVHAFTNVNSGNDPSRGVAYNKQADERSWEKMKEFFKEIFS
jgi:dienelactone hydrolase